MSNKKKLLCFFDYFYPAVRSGGPSISSMGFATHMSSDYSIYVFTRAYDHGMKRYLPGIVPDKWVHLKNFNVYYSSGSFVRACKHVMNEKDIDYYYLNSFFSKEFSILPLLLMKLGQVPIRPVIVAPRGELSSYALSNALHKKVYIKIFQRSLMKYIRAFHATSLHEVLDIKKNIGVCHVVEAPNLRDYGDQPGINLIQKSPGDLRIIAVSRINRIKNIDIAIRSLQTASRGRYTFHVYGFMEDHEYYNHCFNKIQLPSNVNLEYKGELKPEDVVKVIQGYHLFYSPTSTENFGHTIFESLLASRPVLISERTPWKNLESNGVGWDIPLENESSFTRKILIANSWNQNQFEAFCVKAGQLAREYTNRSQNISKYRQIFI